MAKKAKRRPGRNKLPEDELRNRVLHLLFNETEYDWIKLLAAKSGDPLSRWARERVMEAAERCS